MALGNSASKKICGGRHAGKNKHGKKIIFPPSSGNFFRHKKQKKVSLFYTRVKKWKEDLKTHTRKHFIPTCKREKNEMRFLRNWHGLPPF